MTRNLLPAILFVALFAVASRPALADATFGPKTDYMSRFNPFSVAIRDLDGDGKQDLVWVDQGSDSAWVQLGDGAGGFGPATGLAVGRVPSSVALGDVNGDGRPDVVVANRSDDDVSVYLGDGAGGFGAKHDFATGTGPNSVAIGDLNRDGKPDLAVANYAAGTVSVLWGDGAGGFAAPADVTVGALSGALVIGDFNGDGAPDLAVANQGDDDVSVLENDGAGGFPTRLDLPSGPSPRAVAVADVNGDGRLDLLVANGRESVGDDSVSVLLANGMSGFGPRQGFPTGLNPNSIAVGDLDGDGRPDLVTANTGVVPSGTGASNTVSVLLGTGTGEFGPNADFVTGDGPISVALADLNGDGRLDLVAANVFANTVSVLLNTSTVPISVAGDERLDVFTLSPLSPNPSAGRSLVSFAIPVRSRIRITLDDVMGRELAVLEEGVREPGRYTTALDASGLRAGVYFVRMRAAGVGLVRRIAVVK